MEIHACGYDLDHWQRCIAQILSKESLRKLESAFGKHHIGIVTLQIDDFFPLVGTYGEDVSFQLLEILKDEAFESFPAVFTDCEIICIEDARVNGITLCFRLPEKRITGFAGEALSFRIKMGNKLSYQALDIIGRQLDVLVGHSWIGKDRRHGFHKILFKAYCDAQRVAVSRADPSGLMFHKELIEILKKPLLQSLYQPVMSFRSGNILGWEALVRGPEGSPFRDSSVLFGYAEEIGKTFALERKCCEMAIENLGPISSDQILFLNIHMQSLNDPAFTSGSPLDLIEKTGLKPENIVFELSEKHGLQDFSLLLECLEHYRKQGFKVALENVGSGHSSLRSISQIRPDFIKIDMSLTRGIEYNPIKRVMVETFVTLSEKIGAKVIVAGIETETELSSLASMGVHFGQGFLIAKPSCPKPDLCLLMPATRPCSTSDNNGWKCSTPVGMLVQPATHVTPVTTVAEVKQILADTPPMSNVVVVDSQKPVGLLMSYNLDRHLGTTYGIPLFFHREVSRLMDRNPLIVDADMPVEKAAKAAMMRNPRKVYDDIIVTEDGVFTGTISVQKMLDTLAKVQVEMAKGANPLTGLPGNVAIEQEISRRAAGGIASSLIYIDLDNFKAYNDAYGFENGDKMISFTSAALSEAIRREGMPGDFIGHVGGDDFMVISERGRAEGISRAIIEIFEKSIPELYNETDRRRGHIKGRGRDGVESQYPLVSVSIGIVDCEFACSFTMNELSLRVAEIKKYAKMTPGNTYVRDRRAALGSKSHNEGGEEEIADFELRIAE